MPRRRRQRETRNWLDLPRDVTAAILLKLGAVEILTSAQYVCTSWRSISKDPNLWCAIDMRNPRDLHNMPYNLEIMCRHAVDRSCGQLIDINIEGFGTDDLLKYITDSTSHLRRLRLAHCYDVSDDGLAEVAGKLSLLEELDITIGEFRELTSDGLEVVGQNCPNLRSLKFNSQVCECPDFDDEEYYFFDDVAFAIARTMPELRHLQLYRDLLTNAGLTAILDGCPKLESLDLRRCFYINLEGPLGERCARHIKDLRRPYDPSDGYPCDPTDSVSRSYDGDNYFWWSDDYSW